MWCRCNEYLPADPFRHGRTGTAGVHPNTRLQPRRGARILARFVQFHLVQQLLAAGHFAVRRGVPTLQPAQLERLAVHSPHARSRVVEGAGHLMHDEKAHRHIVLDEVLGFLASLP